MIEKEINAMIAADNYDELVEHTIRNIRKWRFHGKKVKEYAERIYEIYCYSAN